MPFELSPSFLTGIGHLDDEHRELVDRINEVAEREAANDRIALIEALGEFKTSLAGHFRSEEEDLKRVSYPKLSSHAKHHSETIVALERLIRAVDDDELVRGGVAGTCFHELVSAVFLQDMEFINWLADHPALKG